MTSLLCRYFFSDTIQVFVAKPCVKQQRVLRVVAFTFREPFEASRLLIKSRKLGGNSRWLFLVVYLRLTTQVLEKSGQKPSCPIQKSLPSYSLSIRCPTVYSHCHYGRERYVFGKSAGSAAGQTELSSILCPKRIVGIENADHKFGWHTLQT